MTIPGRRAEDQGGGISHSDRHTLTDNRILTLERRDLYIMVLLSIDTMLTAGDLVTKVGPIIRTFAESVPTWLTLLPR